MQVMDFGYPQFTEAKILSEFIKTDAHKMEVQARPPMAVTNAVSWRSEGIKYKKNEARSTLLPPLSRACALTARPITPKPPPNTHIRSHTPTRKFTPPRPAPSFTVRSPVVYGLGTAVEVDVGAPGMQ